MQLVELHEIIVNEETLYISDVPMSAVQHVMDFEESGNKDFIALGSLIKCVLKDKNGRPYKQFRNMTGEEVADAIPATLAAELFQAISENAMGKSIEGSKEGSDTTSMIEDGDQAK